MEIFFGILCLVVVLATAALNGAERRIAQHRTTLFQRADNDSLPKWWPSQKHLNITTIVFNWIMVISALTNCILLISIGHAKYVLNLPVCGLICWIAGTFIGLKLASAVITTRGKKNGINVLRECL